MNGPVGLGPYILPSAHLSVCHTFLPEASFGLRVLSLPASACVCVYVSISPSIHPFVNQELFGAITCHPLKLESPNSGPEMQHLD